MTDDKNKQILRYFTNSESITRDVREQSLEDRKFASIAGGMWGDKYLADWTNAPKMEVNKVNLAIVRIINEYRSNRITVDFHNKFGEKNDIASVLDGKFRATEQDSNAEEAYDNCFGEGISGGFGAVRLVTCYEDEEYEDDYEDEGDELDEPAQTIRIEPIFDADCSVFFDAHAKKQDKSDARHVFVAYEMSKEDFIDKYGTEKMADFDVYIPITGAFDWVTGTDKDVIKVAEYYEKEKVKKNFAKFYNANLFNVAGGKKETKEIDLDDDDAKELIAELKLKGWKKEKERKKTVTKIRKYIVSGCGIVEDCGYIAGNCLPIIPFYATHFYIGGKEYYHGHVRFVKDVSRLKNTILSMLAKFASNSSTELPIFHAEQMPPTIAQMWADKDVKNYPYLLVNSIQNANGQSNVVSGPLGYTKVADLPPVLAALIQQTDADISELLGNQEQGDKIASNISDEAIESVQERLEKQAYIFVTNFAKMLRRLGKVWLGMAKEIYVEDNREVKVVDIIGNASKAVLNQNVIDKGIINDMSKANLEVVVDIGASSSTRSEKNTKKLMALLPFIQDPDSVQNITDLIIMNMDFEGQSDIKKYYRNRLVTKGLIEPNEEEKQALLEQQKQEQQPDPQSLYLLASADKLKADTQKIASDVVLNQAKTDLTKADTIKTLQEAGQPIPQEQTQQPQPIPQELPPEQFTLQQP
jgi:hypothetical protein